MELMAASLIGIILMGVVGSIFLTSLNLFSRSEAIQYKEGSVTNVETNLQNAVSTAKALGVFAVASGNYTIGFNENGDCVEFLNVSVIPDKDSDEYKKYIIDQISAINLVYDSGNRVLSYELLPKEESMMSTLKGAIVINNKLTVGGTWYTDSEGIKSQTLSSGNPGYLVIEEMQADD